MPTTATILANAAIGQYLATTEYYSKLGLKGGSIVPLERVQRLIYICRKAIDFIFQKNPSDPTLIPTGNYLYWLVGKFNAIAANIISGGGTGTIINPATGTESTIKGYYIEFTVGDVGAPILDGETSFIIPLPGFIENTVAGDIGGAELPMQRLDQMAFNVDYSNPAQITITFNAPVSNGQFYQFRGLRLQPVASPEAQETFFIVNTYADYLVAATGRYYKRFLVLADEQHGGGRTVQEYWPETSLQWSASVETEDLTS